MKALPLSPEDLALYRALIGSCASADEGMTEARVGDIRTVIGEVADVLFAEDLQGKKDTYFMLLALGKNRAKRGVS